jgi:hypothetical protein
MGANPSMSSVDVKQTVKTLIDHRKKVTSSREKAREFLVRAGILAKSGDTLTPPYR